VSFSLDHSIPCMPFKKKFFILILLLCFAGKTFSQSRQVPNRPEYDLAPYHFGFLLGINQMLFTIKTRPFYQDVTYYNNSTNQSLPDQNVDSVKLYNLEASPTFGFVIGLVGNLRLGEYFDLRFTPALTFGDRNIDYTMKSYFGSSVPTTLIVQKNIQSTFVEFPLWVRFKGRRMHNARPYILAGGKWSLDLASNAKKKVDSNAAFVFLNQKDIYALGGVGFDFYTLYFKFGTEISMSYGLFDVLKRDNNIYTAPISRMSSKIFQISFTFE